MRGLTSPGAAAICLQGASSPLLTGPPPSSSFMPWVPWPIRRSEKHKNLKLILSIVRKLVYIYTKQGSGLKNSNLGHFPMRKWPTKWLWPLYKWKKNCSDYGVHGIQIDRLELTVSTQKSVLKNMHRVLRYRPKCVKFCWFGLEGQFWTLFW